MSRFYVILIFISLSVSLFSQQQKKKWINASPSGNILTETRILPAFAGIDIDHFVDVRVVPDTAYFARIKVDDNILPLLELYTENGWLKYKLRDHTRIYGPFRPSIEIHTRVLYNVKFGTGTLKIDSINCPGFFNVHLKQKTMASIEIYTDTFFCKMEGSVQCGDVVLKLKGYSDFSDFDIEKTSELHGMGFSGQDCYISHSWLTVLNIHRNNFKDVFLKQYDQPSRSEVERMSSMPVPGFPVPR